ncbi:MAG: hypothetical protein KAI43_02905 [Candidatus Aureabacteria bacterium]|nr:hypothetical protein [Candidatus Auribacterota bacterium]
MNKYFSLILIFVLGLVLMVPGCGPKKAASSKVAIENTKSMETVEEKVDYLVGQANAFIKSEDFQMAVDVAQFILSSLDKNSVEAKDLLELAKKGLKAAAKEAVKNIGK